MLKTAAASFATGEGESNNTGFAVHPEVTIVNKPQQLWPNITTDHRFSNASRKGREDDGKKQDRVSGCWPDPNTSFRYGNGTRLVDSDDDDYVEFLDCFNAMEGGSCFDDDDPGKELSRDVPLDDQDFEAAIDSIIIEGTNESQFILIQDETTEKEIGH